MFFGMRKEKPDLVFQLLSVTLQHSEIQEVCDLLLYAPFPLSLSLSLSSLSSGWVEPWR
jgi:hypothetical protein